MAVANLSTPERVGSINRSKAAEYVGITEMAAKEW